MDAQHTRAAAQAVQEIEARTARFAADDLATPYRQRFEGFHAEATRDLMLLVDMSAAGPFDSARRRSAAEVTGALGFAALRNDQAVGMVLFADELELYVPPGRGRFQVLRLIHELLTFEARGQETNLTGAIAFVDRVLSGRTVLALLSDFCLPMDFDQSLEAVQPLLKVMARRHDLVSIALNDPRELELPAVGRIMLDDAGSGLAIEVDTSNPEIQRAYAEETARRWAALRSTFERCGIDLLELRTDEPCAPSLLSFLRRAS